MNLYFTRVVPFPTDYESESGGYFYKVQVWSWEKPFKWYDLQLENDDDVLDAIAIAKKDAAANGGYYRGVVSGTKPENKLLKKICGFFTGPIGQQGLPGAPGPQGPMGMMGPAYDDVECPSCKRRRSQTGVTLFMEVLGDGKFGYTCAKCKTTSTFITSNGVWVLLKPTEK